MRWEGEVGEGTQTRQVGQEEESESEKVSNCAVRCCGASHSADRQTDRQVQASGKACEITLHICFVCVIYVQTRLLIVLYTTVRYFVNNKCIVSVF